MISPEWSPCRVDVRELQRKQRWTAHLGFLGVTLVYAGTIGILAVEGIGTFVTQVGAMLALGFVVSEVWHRSGGDTPKRRLEAQAKERGISGGLWVKVRYVRDGWEYGRDEGLLLDVGPQLAFEGWRTNFVIPFSSLEARNDPKRRGVGEYRVAALGTGIELSFFAVSRPELVSILQSQSLAPARMVEVPPPLAPSPRSINYALERGLDRAPKVFFAIVSISFLVAMFFRMFSPLAVISVPLLGLIGDCLIGAAAAAREDRRRLREWRASLDASLPQLEGG